MNTINNKFSFSRFGAVLKCDLVEHWVRYVGVFAILFFANLAYQLVDIKDVVELSTLRALPVEEYMKQLAIDCVPFFYGVLALALMCAAADMTAVPFKSKGHALNYLVMPATNMEKFLSRAFINVVMVIVMAYVALFLADLARMLYVAISDIEGFYGFTFPTVWNELIETFPSFYRTGGEVWGPTVDGTVRVIGFSTYYGAMNVTTMVAAFLFAHSLFILGGCIWRKAAIIKIWITQIVVTSAVVWIFVKLEPYVLPWLGDVLTSLFETEQHAGMTLMSIAIPVLLALTVFNWWLAYRLFSRKQMIPRTHLFGSKHPHHLFNKAHS